MFRIKGIKTHQLNKNNFYNTIQCLLSLTNHCIKGIIDIRKIPRSNLKVFGFSRGRQSFFKIHTLTLTHVNSEVTVLKLYDLFDKKTLNIYLFSLNCYMKTRITHHFTFMVKTNFIIFPKIQILYIFLKKSISISAIKSFQFSWVMDYVRGKSWNSFRSYNELVWIRVRKCNCILLFLPYKKIAKFIFRRTWSLDCLWI